ncbi:MAG: hypothetical protein HY816_16780 [Candidatus Wallbacteria bacterium]|nr:hypothetical protein [Candidatus Wallbacteria bacterium]
MSSYRQANLKANVSLERDTEHVPHDGKFHLLVDGQATGVFRTLKQAQEAYSRILTERNCQASPDVLPVTEEVRRKMLREAVQKCYDGETAGGLKVPKRSGSRRFG